MEGTNNPTQLPMTSVTVLLHEPDTGTAREVEAAFQASGHTVTRAGSAGEAMELVRTRRFDVVVTAPSIEGVEIAAAARKGPGGDGTFLLFLVDPADLGDLGAVLSEGPSDYIPKPVRTAELKARIAVVSRILSAEPRTRRSYVPESVRAGNMGALQQSEERLRTLVTESPMGILLYDEVGRPIEMNPASMRMFGVSELGQIPNLYESLRIFPEAGAAE